MESYESFRLRAGGNNIDNMRFKDAMLMDLAKGGKYTIAATRPAVVFLNGEYWGPCLLSEKATDKMMHERYGVAKDQVIIMKEGEVDEGADEDQALYDELMSYAEKDLANPKVWSEFCEVMDIQSFADYCAARIYVGDGDWSPHDNDLLWRTRDDSYNDGKWQYILYDIETSSGQYGDPHFAADYNHIELTLARYPLFAAAMRNGEFHELFLESLMEMQTERFSPQHVNELMLSYQIAWLPLMADCFKRYGDTSHGWSFTAQAMITFFEQRPEYMTAFVEQLE